VTSTDDPYVLQRFVEAQAPVIEQVEAELAAGHKTSHWIWYVFPQIVGLGYSAMSLHFAVDGPGEAAAFLAHPVLGPRLRSLTAAINRVEGRTALEILGTPDDLKFRSSMTLFDAVAPGDVFRAALDRYFEGVGDPLTLEMIRDGAPAEELLLAAPAPALAPEGIVGAGNRRGGLDWLRRLRGLRRGLGSRRD
jgi:uncharacterized protein (DUF1810 family)